MSKIVVLSILMALVTVPSRVLPAFCLTDKKLPPFVESLLLYVPFAVLGALIFPDIIFSTGDIKSAVAGFAVAFLLGWREVNILIVLAASISAALAVTLFL